MRELDGPPIGNDWTALIPDDLYELWHDLPTEARLVAFIISARHTSGEPSTADFDLDT